MFSLNEIENKTLETWIDALAIVISNIEAHPLTKNLIQSFKPIPVINDVDPIIDANVSLNPKISKSLAIAFFNSLPQARKAIDEERKIVLKQLNEAIDVSKKNELRTLNLKMLSIENDMIVQMEKQNNVMSHTFNWVVKRDLLFKEPSKQILELEIKYDNAASQMRDYRLDVNNKIVFYQKQFLAAKNAQDKTKCEEAIAKMKKQLQAVDVEEKKIFLFPILRNFKNEILKLTQPQALIQVKQPITKIKEQIQLLQKFFDYLYEYKKDVDKNKIEIKTQK